MRKEKLLICGQLRNLRLKFLVTVSMKFDFQNLFGYTKIVGKLFPGRLPPKVTLSQSLTLTQGGIYWGEIFEGEGQFTWSNFPVIICMTVI